MVTAAAGHDYEFDRATSTVRLILSMCGAVPLKGYFSCGCGVGDIPRWVGISSQHGTGSGGPLVTLIGLVCDEAVLSRGKGTLYLRLCVFHT